MRRLQTAVPLGSERSSGSRVKLPVRMTRLILVAATVAPFDGHLRPHDDFENLVPSLAPAAAAAAERRSIVRGNSATWRTPRGIRHALDSLALAPGERSPALVSNQEPSTQHGQAAQPSQDAPPRPQGRSRKRPAQALSVLPRQDRAGRLQG